MLILLVVLAALVPLWGLAALREPWQIYLLAVVFGGKLPGLASRVRLLTRPPLLYSDLRLVPSVRSDLLRRARAQLSIGALVRPLLHHRQK